MVREIISRPERQTCPPAQPSAFQAQLQIFVFPDLVGIVQARMVSGREALADKAGHGIATRPGDRLILGIAAQRHQMTVTHASCVTDPPGATKSFYMAGRPEESGLR